MSEPAISNSEDQNASAVLALALTNQAGAQIPHSATRFVLPFNLRRAKLAPTGGRTNLPRAQPTPVYRKAASTDDGQTDWIWVNIAARRKYFTDETQKVLFERATWWVMDCCGQPITMTAPDDNVLRGIVRPPALILFEQLSGEDLLCRGFLVVEVAFQGNADGQVRLDDLLLFNELFRYWREPWMGHSVEFAKQLGGFNAPFRTMAQLSAASCPTGNFSYAERWLLMLQVPLADGLTLLTDAPKDPDTVFGDYADDRAFVWTRALLSEPEMRRIIPYERDSSGFRKAVVHPRDGFRDMFGYWVKLLNADKPLMDYQGGSPSRYKEWTQTNGTTAFERDWAAKHTYRRWEEEDCYYGFNMHCAAMLSKAPPEYLPTWLHWFQMYFDQVLLLLYLRVTLFAFSRGLTEISSEMAGAIGRQRAGDLLGNWQQNFRKLRRAFTCFENLYQFPLLSNQQQAVEMYECARRSMDIDALYEEISKEVRSSDELLQNELEEERSEYAHVLNHVAAVGLGLSVALSCYQIDGFQSWWAECCVGHATVAPFLWAIIWVMLFLVLVEILKRCRRARTRRGSTLGELP